MVSPLGFKAGVGSLFTFGGGIHVIYLRGVLVFLKFGQFSSELTKT